MWNGVLAPHLEQFTETSPTYSRSQKFPRANEEPESLNAQDHDAHPRNLEWRAIKLSLAGLDGQKNRGVTNGEADRVWARLSSGTHDQPYGWNEK